MKAGRSRTHRLLAALSSLLPQRFLSLNTPTTGVISSGILSLPIRSSRQHRDHRHQTTVMSASQPPHYDHDERRTTTTSSSSISSSTGNLSSLELINMPVSIYPFDPNDYLSIEKDPHRKSLHFLRHAEGQHNVNQQYRDLANLDARITERGLDQCRTLSTTLQTNGWLAETSDILIVTSPMTRCLQTTLYGLESIIATKQPPIVALEYVRETVNFNCDRRRRISELTMEFPMVDFSHITADVDPIWSAYEERLGDHVTYTAHRESAELYVVAERARQFLVWLRHQPQSHVIVCTHSAFLRCLKNYGYGVPSKPHQALDDRDDPVEQQQQQQGGGAVLQYHCADFGSTMKKNYDNCELRSMTATFR